MSLSEKLKKKACKSERVTVDGDVFVVTGKSLNDTAAIMAKARKANGTLNGDKLDRLLLEACVTDPDDGSNMPADEWGGVSRHITGPLMATIMSVCGMDKDDFQRDPKDSDSTES